MSTVTSTSSHDGLTLTRRVWSPNGQPRASVVLVHGLGEHAGRYEHVGDALAAAGYEVSALDLRGHGASEGDRAHVAEFQHFIKDLAAEMASTAPPRVLLGHSLGGLIATKYVLDAEPKPDYLILSAPALGSGVPKVKQVAARVLGRLLPKLRIPNDFEGSELSRNPDVGEAYFSDPLVITKTSTGLGKASLEAIDDAVGRTHEISMPTLVIHGGDDTIVPPHVSAPLAALENVERKLFPSFRHESFNENEGTEAIGVVLAWLDERLASTD